MKYEIGQKLIDEDGCKGVVGIQYDDGDFVFMPDGQDAAHPNPNPEDRHPYLLVQKDFGDVYRATKYDVAVLEEEIEDGDLVLINLHELDGIPTWKK